jgi:hypothetical protein
MAQRTRVSALKHAPRRHTVFRVLDATAILLDILRLGKIYRLSQSSVNPAREGASRMIALGPSWTAHGRMDSGIPMCGPLWAGALLAAIPLCATASSALARSAPPPALQCESSSAAPQWWLDLSLPPLARIPAGKRQAHLQAIQQQQMQITEILAQQGIAVCARVTNLRNALAVQASAEQAAQLRSITGVRAVSAVSQRNRLHDATAPKHPEQGRK